MFRPSGSLFLLLFFLHYSQCFSGNSIDSLKAALLSEKNPASQCSMLCDVSNNYRVYGEFDSAVLYADKAIALSKKIRNDSALATAFMNKGNALYSLGKYDEALNLCIEGLKLSQKNNTEDETAANLYNLAGTLELVMGQHNKAVSYFENGIRVCTSLYAKTKRKRFEKLSARLNSNIATVYAQLGDFKKAVKYFEETAAHFLRMGDSAVYATSLSNVGAAYFYLKEYDVALKNYYLSKQISKRFNDRENLCRLAENITSVYIEKNLFREAEAELRETLPLAKAIHSFEMQALLYNSFYQVYSKQKDTKLALENHILYTAVKDSMFNESSRRQMNELNTKYETEKKEQQITLLDKEKKMGELEVEHQRSQRNTLFIGLALVVLILGFVAYGFFQKSRNNKILESKNKEILLKNHTIEEKNKEILDSINYAQRLQKAILVRPDELKSSLPDAFLLYKPKDIVAGDFYFYEESASKIFIAAADCTGHGVPGALVSVVCSNALSRCVKEMRLEDPAEILNRTRELVLETFAKSDADVKDGMDISLVAVEKNSLKNESAQKTIVQWAGAYNPLWYISGNELKEISADKQPIGKSENQKPFTSHHLELHKGDALYLLTDGYADQFGGPKGKKFKYKQLQELLIVLSGKAMNEQEEMLGQSFEKWKGSLEQVDDVCIIGIRL